MEKQKTAVEWFAEELSFLNNEYDMNRMTPKMYIDRLHMIEDKAKQMEKEQIELAFFEGKNDGAFMERYSDYKHITANEHYNETYGKDENKAENND